MNKLTFSNFLRDFIGVTTNHIFAISCDYIPYLAKFMRIVSSSLWICVALITLHRHLSH